MTGITAELSRRLAAVGRGRAAPGAGRPVLVAVAHGSRDPEAVRTVGALLAAVRGLRPEVPVALGHIELNEPLLTDTLAALSGTAVLVPLLFGHGHHVTHDIPTTLAAARKVRYGPAEADRPAASRADRADGTAPDRADGDRAGTPRARAGRAGDDRAADGRSGSAAGRRPLAGRVAAPLGAHPLLAEALAGRLAEAGWRGDGVVLAAAGSRAPRSAADTEATAALLAARLGVPVQPAYASAAAPTVTEAARALAARGCRRIGVACCFTAPGLFARRVAADARALGVPVAAPLGAHPALARLVLHRYDEQLAARTPRRPAAA